MSLHCFAYQHTPAVGCSEFLSLSRQYCQSEYYDETCYSNVDKSAFPSLLNLFSALHDVYICIVVLMCHV